MESNRSSRFAGLVQSIKQTLPLYSSWAQYSSDIIAKQNHAHLFAWDLEFHEREIGPDQLLDQDTGSELRSWLEVSINSAEAGRIDEVNIGQGAELFQPRLDEIRSGIPGIPDASLPFGTNSRPILLRYDHVDECLAQASEHLLEALICLSSCCDGDHIARIQLCEFQAAGPGQNDRSFGLFLSSNRNNANCVWHEMICEVTRGPSDFLVSQDTIDLCRLLPESAELGRPLGLRLDRRSGSFHLLPHEPHSARRRLDSPRVCLGELIDNRALMGCNEGGHYPPINKARLCLNLALGMLHLSAKAWLQTPWSIDNIYFTIDNSPISRIPDIARPYLSRTLQIQYTAPTHGSEPLAVARSPVLAFAQVIAEICLGKRLPQHSYANDTYLLEILDRFTQSSDIMESQHGAVLEVVSACVNFYVDQRSNVIRRNVPIRNPDPDWVFDRIVRRLEKVLACFYRSNDNRSCFELEYSWKETSVETKSRTEAPLISSQRLIGRAMTRSLHTTEKTWFHKLGSLNHVLDATTYLGNDSKVKIAVLDTGIDPEYQFVDDIGDYFDFVEPGNKDRLDTTGHGTSIVDLIYRVYQHAEVYVARVFESTDATPETPRHVNEAIDWARGHGVDVICMAFGFEADVDTVEALLNHIKSAVADRILLFAAASNDSFTSDVMLPARLDDNVFCMFSTDAGGRHSRSINPPALDAFYNFAILGEDVKLYEGNLKSGCSYSTAIACAFAARLLDFSRQGDVASRLEHARFLTEKRGMAMVLSKLSEKEAEYQCIKPWKLLGRKWDHGAYPSASALENAREKIRTSISEVLEQYY